MPNKDDREYAGNEAERAILAPLLWSTVATHIEIGIVFCNSYLPQFSRTCAIRNRSEVIFSLDQVIRMRLSGNTMPPVRRMSLIVLTAETWLEGIRRETLGRAGLSETAIGER